MEDHTNTQDDQRPQMTEKELTFHTTVARIRARRKAADKGGDPDSKEALAAGAIGGLRINGLHIKPLGPGTLWVLEKLGSVFASPEGGRVSTEELCIAAYAFAYPDESWELLELGYKDQLRREAAALALTISLDEFKQINEFVAREFARMENAAGNESDVEPGKLQPAQTASPQPHPGTSPRKTSSETQVPVPDGPSPSSSSSCQNTDTASAVPSSHPLYQPASPCSEPPAKDAETPPAQTTQTEPQTPPPAEPASS